MPSLQRRMTSRTLTSCRRTSCPSRKGSTPGYVKEIRRCCRHHGCCPRRHGSRRPGIHRWRSERRQLRRSQGWSPIDTCQRCRGCSPYDAALRCRCV
jgi:hypothetical protein